MISLSPKYIAFLYISHPPNVYDLKRAEEAARKTSKPETFQSHDVESLERQQLLNSLGCFKTIYVHLADLQVMANPRANNRVLGTSPAVADLGHDKENLKKFAGNPQFCWGMFYPQDQLFLIDDIFEWSHHRLPWSKVRTAQSIIDAEKHAEKSS